MDESDFLEELKHSPGDFNVLSRYADWLESQNDARGEYLRTEIEIRKTREQLDRLETKSHNLSFDSQLDSGWLDELLPIDVKSPMVGRFYRAPDPEGDPYVEIGSICRTNTIVCAVEAMKIFNQIEAETEGVISECLVENGEAVQFGQTLFKLVRIPHTACTGWRIECQPRVSLGTG